MARASTGSASPGEIAAITRGVPRAMTGPMHHLVPEMLKGWKAFVHARRAAARKLPDEHAEVAGAAGRRADPAATRVASPFMLACPDCRKLYPNDATSCEIDGAALVPLEKLPDGDPHIERGTMLG